MWKNFSLWREKSWDKLRINSLFIKSIIIILVYVSQLKKNISYFSLLSHTLIMSFKGDNTLLSPFYFLLHAQLSLGCLLFSKGLTLCCSLSFFLVRLPLSLLLHILLVPFILSWFHALFFLSPNGGLLGQSQQIFCNIVYL